jgi:hypothetical protein
MKVPTVKFTKGISNQVQFTLSLVSWCKKGTGTGFTGTVFTGQFTDSIFNNTFRCCTGGRYFLAAEESTKTFIA